MKMRNCSLLFIGVCLLAYIFVQIGCGSDSTSSSRGSTGTTISGNVAAPGGVIAFNQSRSLWNMIAKMFTSDAVAALPGVAAVGSGVLVNLIQIDNAGNQVGSALATTTTDNSGNYSLQPPTGFTPGANYVIQAAGSNLILKSFATGNSVSVDPYTHATVSLITTTVSQGGISITGVSSADVDAVQQTVLGTSGDVSTTSTTATQLSSDLIKAITNNTELNNIVTSIPSPGSITGAVTDSSGVPAVGIQILVRTFGDQTTQAMTRTNSSGQYTVHVPAGDYVIAALNDTATYTGASQYWTSSGGTTNQWAAEKVTVGVTSVTKTFTLSPGGRISGKVTTGSSNTTLPGILITLCDFSSGQTMMFVRTLPDGTYNFNVLPGKYYLSFRNTTIAPYATGLYNSLISGGGSNKTQAERLTIVAGSTITANMGLIAGGSIQGFVTDPTIGNIAGISLRFHDSTGAFAEGVRTNKDGGYRLWVLPGSYNIYTRGQTATGLAVDAGANVTQSFNATVGKITTVLTDVNGNPVSQAFVYLYDTAVGTNYQMLGYEITNGDGSVTLYGMPSANVFLSFVIADGRMIGSQVYNGARNYPTNGTPVSIPAALGTISLPAGAILTGFVNSASTGQPLSNSIVQMRYGGKGGAFRLQSIRSMIDGTYTISLPASIAVTRLCAFDVGVTVPGTGTSSAPAVASGAGYAYTDSLAIGVTGSTTIAPVLAY